MPPSGQTNLAKRSSKTQSTEKKTTLKDSNDHPESSWSAFKRAQTRYRKSSHERGPPLEHNEIVDFHCQHERIQEINFPKESEDLKSLCYSGPIYTLDGFPGFLYAPQALDKPLQKQLAWLALTEYCEKPHRTNIDLVPPKKSEEDNSHLESFWDTWKEAPKNLLAKNTHVQKESNKTNDFPKKVQCKKKYKSFQKLSWATMGYHYDWTLRAYHREVKSPMPNLLVQLSKLFAYTSMLQQQQQQHSSCLSFTPSACIVNYYHTKSLMGGHRDDLEHALDKPVISISMGLPAIFLLGGATKDDQPIIPILVHPGDVMILGGKSRLNYHGMARVIPTASQETSRKHDQVSLQTLQVFQKNSLKDGSATESLLEDNSNLLQQGDQELERFLSSHRININVRQVYAD